MLISWVSSSFKGEIRVRLCRDYHMSVRDLFYSKNRDLSKSDRVCGSESCHEQRRLPRTAGKELMLLIRLEEVTKPSLKSLDKSTVRQTVYKWRKFMPLLPSPKVVDQQRSL